MTLTLTIALLFIVGYASQRSGVCMVRAAHELIVRQRFHRLAGFLVAAASAMLVMALAEAAGTRPFTSIIGTPPDMFAVAGGVIFGLGAWLNGHCALGTLAALTAGNVSRIATLAAMFVAAIMLGPAMSGATLMIPPRPAFVSPLAGNVAAALGLGGAMALIATAYLYRRLRWRRPNGGWPPLIAMTLIGAASGALYALDQRWVYTGRIAEVAYGELGFTLGTAAGPMALVAAMTVAAVTGGQFQWQWGTMREWVAAAVGGLLMGLGATLVPGGNDTMLFTGIPLLLPNLLVAYAAFFVTLLAGLRIVGRAARG